MHSDRFTKRYELAQMDKHRMQEQAHPLRALEPRHCGGGPGPVHAHQRRRSFCRACPAKTRGKERLSLLLAQKKEEKEEKEHKKRSVPSPTEKDIKPSPTKEDKKNKKKEEAPKKKEEAKGQESALEHPC